MTEFAFEKLFYVSEGVSGITSSVINNLGGRHIGKPYRTARNQKIVYVFNVGFDRVEDMNELSYLISLWEEELELGNNFRSMEESKNLWYRLKKNLWHRPKSWLTS